jgi:amidase
MTKSDLTDLDATGQADLVSNGEISPLELVEAAIARAERIDGELNSIITPLYDEARRAAAGELPSGPFRGVPFTLKDLGAYQAGVPHSSGSKLLKDKAWVATETSELVHRYSRAGPWVATETSELVHRYSRAGLVVIGRTNTPEFGILPATEPEAFGATKNPWDLTRSTSGSSGGAAASVAARIVPFAHASDGGGSIRHPAAVCGLFGLKPTRGRNPFGPHLGDSRSGLGAEHAVTLSVRDSAKLLDCTSGPDLGDPYFAPPTARPFAEEVGVDPGKLRIALQTHALNGAPVHGDCVEGAKDAARLCEELGHHVEEAAPDIGDPMEMSAAFVTLWAAGVTERAESAARQVGEMSPRREMFEACTWALVEMGRTRSAADYLSAVTTLQRISRRVARFFETYDVLITPVLSDPPVPLGTFGGDDASPLMPFFKAGQHAAFCALFNATGQPAASVPLFWNDAGLPIGTQFVTRFGDEATLFRLASQLETARPWMQRRPSVCA